MSDLLPHVAELVRRLNPWANQIAARFGHPVYLVGSALEHEDPRDVDVVCLLPDAEFWGRYGRYQEHARIDVPWGPEAKRWGEDMAKLSAYAAKHLALNVDLKVQAHYLAQHWYGDAPRVRLDDLDLGPQEAT